MKPIRMKIKPLKIREASLIDTGTKQMKDRRKKRLKQKVRREIQQEVNYYGD